MVFRSTNRQVPQSPCPICITKRPIRLSEQFIFITEHCFKRTNVKLKNGTIYVFVQITCVSVRPVFFARVLFSSGVGYLNIYIGGLVFYFKFKTKFFLLTCYVCTYPSRSSVTSPRRGMLMSLFSIITTTKITMSRLS